MVDFGEEKEFVIAVKKGKTDCKKCRIKAQSYPCQWLNENGYCQQWDFSCFHISEKED